MQVDLRGQVALVTGAAKGIGRAIADTLAANGARVVYTDRDRAGGAEAAAAAGGEHLFFPLDVANGAEVDAVVAEAARAAGALDILVNNAGIGVTGGDRKTIYAFPVETC